MVTKDAPSTVLSKNSWSREGTSLKEMWASFSLACHLPTFKYVRMLLLGLGRGRTYILLQEVSNLLWKYFGVCWLQGTGGISIYGSSFEDENFTRECLGSSLKWVFRFSSNDLWHSLLGQCCLSCLNCLVFS